MNNHEPTAITPLAYGIIALHPVYGCNDDEVMPAARAQHLRTLKTIEIFGELIVAP